MKLFKSICSVALVLAVIFSMGVCAFASGDTYYIEIPDGFTIISDKNGVTKWLNEDVTIAITGSVTENTKPQEKKTNPADFTPEQVETFKKSVTELFSDTYSEGEVLSVSAEIMDFGELSALKGAVTAEFSFGGTINWYYYIFETENYQHIFIVISEEDISELADSIIRTVRIFDEPVKSLVKKKAIARVIATAITAALIGTVAALIVLIALKTSKKKSTVDYESVVTLTPDYSIKDSDYQEKPTEDNMPEDTTSVDN